MCSFPRLHREDKSFSDPAVKYSFSATNHAGFDASNPSDIPMCDMSGLGPLKLPVALS
jgi:hypothetical protein